MGKELFFIIFYSDFSQKSKMPLKSYLFWEKLAFPGGFACRYCRVVSGFRSAFQK
jgi:hypothetical protein